MREVVILSGKGGTGKTSLAGSLAAIVPNNVMADCDVDAADLHLLLQPTATESHEFWSGQVARIDKERCTQCGICQTMCRFHAISGYKVDPIACEGCGFCAELCPFKAITMKPNLSGHWFVSQTAYGPLVHARLGIGQENSGKLVALVRQKAREIAERDNLDYILSDGPPGTGCPVISSLSGADLALIVTEPTLSGRHDLERVLGVCRHFNIPALVAVNKYDINEDNTQHIEDYCHNLGVAVAARIPYDNVVTRALAAGKPVVEYDGDSAVSREINKLWQQVSQTLAGSRVN